LLPIFRLSKARGERIPAAVCNRRATPERRKSGNNPQGKSALGCLAAFLAPHRLPRGHARRSRLAIQPKAFLRDMAGYINRLLNEH
jgi:hypothetical protein